MIKKKCLINKLIKRNYISEIINKKKLKKKISKHKIVLYCGFDINSNSLHLGHLVPIMFLKIFQLNGHKPIILLGDSTAKIGDLNLKKKKYIKNKNIFLYIKKIKKQIKSFLNFNCGKNRAKILINSTWLNKINVIDFMCKVGNYFSINKIINNKVIKSKIEKGILITYKELSYILLQGYDFLYLNKKYNVQLQIGGTDQLCNILSGINLIKKINSKNTFGITLNLIIKKNNVKMGKSESNAIWLDEKKTSPYDFYQFLINTDDNNVLNLLKLLTFVNIKKIKINNNKNILQKLLADKVTKFVHGKKKLLDVKKITKLLFNTKIDEFKYRDFIKLSKNINTLKLKKMISLKKVLLMFNLSNSIKNSKKIISFNSIYINGIKNNNINYIFTKKDLLFNKFTLIRKGKKNFCLIYWLF